jgi:hypothetical protein
VAIAGSLVVRWITRLSSDADACPFAMIRTPDTCSAAHPSRAPSKLSKRSSPLAAPNRHSAWCQGAAPDLAGTGQRQGGAAARLFVEARDTFEISAREVLPRASDRLLGGGRARLPTLTRRSCMIALAEAGHGVSPFRSIRTGRWKLQVAAL